MDLPSIFHKYSPRLYLSCSSPLNPETNPKPETNLNILGFHHSPHHVCGLQLRSLLGLTKVGTLRAVPVGTVLNFEINNFVEM